MVGEGGGVRVELVGRLVRRFRWVDPGPASAHLVSDVSGWWRDADIMGEIGPALGELFRADRPTVVVAPEVTGLLLGPLVAVALGVGFASAHKRPVPQDPGQGSAWPAAEQRAIAEPTSWARTGPDHRGRVLAFGVRDRHLAAGDRVLLVDDWVSTGAQALAVRQVVEARGAELVGTAAIVADCPADVARQLRLRALLTAAELGP